MSTHPDEDARGHAAWMRHYELVELRRRQVETKRSRRWPSSRVRRRRQVAILAIALLSTAAGAALLTVLTP